MTDTVPDDLLTELRTEIARLRRVADITEITQLVARYGPLVDSGSASATAQLWTEDGTYSVGGLLELTGRPAIEEMVRSPLHQGYIQGGAGHVLTTPTVTVADDEAVAYNHSLLVTADGDGFRIARLTANRWVLRRTDHGWQVAQRENHVLDGQAAGRELFAQSARTGPDPAS